MKLALFAFACVCSFFSSHAQATPPTALERLKAFGFPLDEHNKPSVGLVQMCDKVDMYVFGTTYAILDRLDDKVIRSGPLGFNASNPDSIDMVLFGDSDRIEVTFTKATVSDTGVIAYADRVQGPTLEQLPTSWYDFAHVHAELVDKTVVPPTTQVTQLVCYCACPDGSRSPTGCAPDQCHWQQACTCPSGTGQCRWLDPDDCGSHELGLALLAAACGVALLRRVPARG